MAELMGVQNDAGAYLDAQKDIDILLNEEEAHAAAAEEERLAALAAAQQLAELRAAERLHRERNDARSATAIVDDAARARAERIAARNN